MSTYPLRPTTASPHPAPGRRRPTLLLTGGSGVLGRALIDELVRDFDLVCLRHHRPLADPRVREVGADLVAPGLGLTARERYQLATEVDVVLHSAAQTNWRTPPEDIWHTNTQGTAGLLELAARADAPFYYMSTAFVASELGQEDRERFPGAAAYLASKTAAEQMVRDSGQPGAILRPSVVMGDSGTGRIAGQQGLTKALGAIVLGQVPVLPGAPEARVDMVPQDFVARATGDLVRAGVTGGEYWLTAGKEAPLLREVVEVCQEFAVDNGLPKPPSPRLIPVEAVHRLLLPMLEGTALPETMRKRFRYYAELLLVFQRELPFDSSMGVDGIGRRPSHAAIRAALRRNVDSWAEGRPGLLDRRVAAGAGVREMAS
ncbi:MULTISPECIES: SDR family oxidoreductase [Streptomycetaceae]|uniref:Putative ketoreductase n=1 Tax=Streptantibioticus cattleyicolor (strain ATCC 35852 / DSM 46488 / JCM 4925 / NBRC 14057 / NRRL 8057) TaxID=1003195 RepID=F8JSQ3_STREN|nr:MULTISPECIES: SDR family oxidoreductase [Streptomycetaceae]AEW97959.1 putative ketoreductase [Streptantibioticus cattleyicolor NRRL 8057 = DSM 46488]MYS62362.1 NAD-dependent epimerase/dehydratase family protein [Streptomyces sp. SID5468]CCB78277.1 putative ketoreductase [Streptantibioticus cattleyicolor NRRL 8057 = DSM 46488]